MIWRPTPSQAWSTTHKPMDIHPLLWHRTLISAFLSPFNKSAENRTDHRTNRNVHSGCDCTFSLLHHVADWSLSNTRPRRAAGWDTELILRRTVLNAEPPLVIRHVKEKKNKKSTLEKPVLNNLYRDLQALWLVFPNEMTRWLYYIRHQPVSNTAHSLALCSRQRTNFSRTRLSAQNMKARQRNAIFTGSAGMCKSMGAS